MQLITPSLIRELEKAGALLSTMPPYKEELAEQARQGLISRIAGLVTWLQDGNELDDPGQLQNVRQHLCDAELISDRSQVEEALAFSSGPLVQKHREAIAQLTGIWPRELLVAPLAGPFPRPPHPDGNQYFDFGWLCRGTLIRIIPPELQEGELHHTLLHELVHAAEGLDTQAEAYERWDAQDMALEGANEIICNAIGSLAGPVGARYPASAALHLLAREQQLTTLDLALKIWQSPRPLLHLTHSEKHIEPALDIAADELERLTYELAPLYKGQSLAEFIDLAEKQGLRPSLPELATPPSSAGFARSAIGNSHYRLVKSDALTKVPRSAIRHHYLVDLNSSPSTPSSAAARSGPA